MYVVRLYKKTFFVFEKKKRSGKPFPVHLLEESFLYLPTFSELYGSEEDDLDDYKEGDLQDLDSEEKVEEENEEDNVVADSSDSKSHEKKKE